MSSRLGLVLFVTLIGTCSWSRIGNSGGQEPPARVAISPREPKVVRRGSPANFRLDLKMVLVPVSVSDSLDKPITTLSRHSFRILEDGVEQTITSFSQEDAPQFVK